LRLTLIYSFKLAYHSHYLNCVDNNSL